MVEGFVDLWFITASMTLSLSFSFISWKAYSAKKCEFSDQAKKEIDQECEDAILFVLQNVVVSLIVPITILAIW